MSKVRWVVRRLFTMSPWELVYRAAQMLRINILDRLDSFRRPPPSSFEFRPPLLRCEGSYPRRYLSADSALDVFRFRIKDIRSFGTWRHDPRSGKASPLRFHADVNKEMVSRGGDAKYIFEISRFHHLPWLARDYRVTGDTAHLDIITAQLTKWGLQNPYLMGINWKNGIEVAIRSINWLISWSLLAPLVPDSSPLPGLLSRLLAQNQRYLVNHPSLYSSANNHRLAEITGIMFIAYHAPSHNATRIAATYRCLLFRELQKQVHDDGFQKEQSTHYHAFSLELFFLAFLLMDRAGDAVPDWCWQKVQLMALFLLELTDCGGNTVELGDGDEGHVIRCVQDPDFSLYKSLFLSAALQFDEPEFLRHVSYFDERNYLLYGDEGLTRYNEMSSCNTRHKPIAPIAKLFHQSGYFVYKDKDTKLVFDCGPTGYPSIAAHGHADALQTTLSVRGFPYFVDPGTFSYFAPVHIRNYFRGTSAHNTVRIAQRDQCRPGGRMMWTSTAQVRILKTSLTSPFCISAEHDGYHRQGINATHKRTLTCSPDEKKITILDEIVSGEPCLVEIYFHLHPEIEDVRISDETATIKRTIGHQITLTGDVVPNMRIVEGDDDLPLGWHSDRYDHRQPCKTLLAETTCSKNLCILTAIHY